VTRSPSLRKRGHQFVQLTIEKCGRKRVRRLEHGSAGGSPAYFLYVVEKTANTLVAVPGRSTIMGVKAETGPNNAPKSHSLKVSGSYLREVRQGEIGNLPWRFTASERPSPFA
jgi:hypothetical protein